MGKIAFEYTEHKSRESLDKNDRILVEQAFEAARDLAYAPYSQFKVGAALRLEDGNIVKGSNQENAALPAGLCAERTALSAASNYFPNRKIEAIAVAYVKEEVEEQMANTVLAPCGTCRQSIAEYVARQKSPIALLLCSANGRIFKIENAMDLLPLSFGADML